MKKLTALLLSIIMVLALVVQSSALSTVAVKSIKLDKSTLALKVGQTYKLAVTFTPNNTTQKQLVFSTSNKKVATVDADGLVTAVGGGSAVITATSSSNPKITDKCTVTAPQDDPLGKYDPPISLTSVMAVGADCKFKPGEDINNNNWTRAYLSDLGIKWSYDWCVDYSQAAAKMNLAIASNNLPDVFVAGNDVYKNLYDSDMIWDLTDVYDRYATADTKQVLQEDAIGFKSAHIEGKLMGLPLVDSSVASAALLWVRNDWLKNLNLPVPKTMQQLIYTAQEFARRDPDGNGKADTSGFAFCKNLFAAYADMRGFFNGYHAYPMIWLDDSKGGITYGSIQPQMKTALKSLQDIFKSGLIDKEFGVKDVNKVSQELAAGKFGIEYGSWWNPDLPLNYSKNTDPKADWIPLNIVSADSKPALAQYGNYVSQYVVVNKKCKHPAAVVKMMNYWWNIIKHPTLELANKFIADLQDPNSGIVYYKYINILGWEPDGNLNKFVNINNALKTGKIDGLGLDELETLKVLQQYQQKGDITQWPAWAEFGPGGAVANVIKNRDGLSKCDLWYGAYTPTMAEKLPTLRKMQDEMITNIILGAPMDTFDKYVADFKKLGGDDIIKEANDWYHKNYK